MTQHTTITGHTIDYDPTPDVAAFLDRVRKLAADPTTTENDLITLAYSRENPILDQGMFLDRGAVTKEVLERPEYRVLVDILGRKRLEQEGRTLEYVAAQYTMGVAEASRMSALSVSAIRQAITSGKLPSRIHEGQHRLNPRHVAAFALASDTGTRGPKRERTHPVLVGEALDVCFGARDGASLKFRTGGAGFFSIQTDGGVSRVTDPNMIAGVGGVKRAKIDAGWSVLHVFSALDRGGKPSARYQLLRPSTEPNELRVGDTFFVRGKFLIENVENNPRIASEMFESDAHRIAKELYASHPKDLYVWRLYGDSAKEHYAVVEFGGIEMGIKKGLFEKLLTAGAKNESPLERVKRRGF